MHTFYTHTTVRDQHFIAPLAGSRIEGVIWLKAISKAGMGLHSNLSLYLPSFVQHCIKMMGFLLR
jgi:hypothetical protein